MSETKVKSTSVIKFDYIAIKTGYTSRVVCYYLNLGVKFKLIYSNKLKAKFNVESTSLRAPTREQKEASDDIPELYPKRLDDQWTGNYYREYDNIDDEEDNDDKIFPIYIEDSLWGEGTYVNEDNIDEIDTVNMINKCIKETTDYTDGLIVFKYTDNLFDILHRIKELNYCGLFGIMDINVLIDNKTNKKILFVKYDSESG